MAPVLCTGCSVVLPQHGAGPLHGLLGDVGDAAAHEELCGSAGGLQQQPGGRAGRQVAVQQAQVGSRQQGAQQSRGVRHLQNPPHLQRRQTDRQTATRSPEAAQGLYRSDIQRYWVRQLLWYTLEVPFSEK